MGRAGRPLWPPGKGGKPGPHARGGADGENCGPEPLLLVPGGGTSEAPPRFSPTRGSDERGTRSNSFASARSLLLAALALLAPLATSSADPSPAEGEISFNLPFPVPPNMTDPEIPSSYLPVVLSDLSNRGADQNQPPGRWNLTSRAVLDTCNSYRGGGTARFTQYWIPIEGMQDAPLGIPAVLRGPHELDLIECRTNHSFGKTSRAFYDACHTQGTCFTRNKVLLNLVGHQCFRALNRQRFPFGIGSRNNALEPFVSVAVNDLPFGTFLFLRELYGKVVPGTGGKVHNGCVRVDDVGWGLDPCHVDFFALTYFRWKPQNWGTRVTARVVPRCRVGSYVSSALGR